MVNYSELSTGTKVRSNRDLIEAACGEHPNLLYAKEGDLLIVRKLATRANYSIGVSHEDRPNDFFYASSEELDLEP